MVTIADRIAQLGTETAFAVSAEANTFAAQGNKIYPFHLGDINLPTPSTVVEGSWKALHDGKTGYCPNAGIPQLRETLAADVSASHHVEYGPENVAAQPGGKPTIGKFILALMNPGDEVLYPNPGYPIYESQIEFNGGIAVPYGYVEGESNFRLDFQSIEQAITPMTRLLILNDLQNPTGAECSMEEHERLAELVRKHDLYVLADEAYFDMRYEGISRSFVEQPGMAERTVILYTFSKRFAMTGWRLGASIGPKEIIDVIAKINVNDESCSNHFIQYGAVAGLTGDQSEVIAIRETLKERRDALAAGLNSIAGVHTYVPNATFYLYPNVTEAAANLGMNDYEVFRRAVLHNTGVSFTNRLHFGRVGQAEPEKHIRFAYSGINLDEINEGVAKMKAYLEG
jgi:aspartate/methionine/tyrosine aminotransferase